MSQESRSSRIFKVVLIIVVLFGMPTLGLYYLNKGTSTYMDSKAEMLFYKDSIDLKDFKTQTVEGEVFNKNILQGNMAVIHFYDPNCEDCDSILQVLNKMKHQFKELETKRLYFVTYLLNADSLDVQEAVIKKNQLLEDKWKFVKLSKGALKDQLLDNLKMKESKDLNKIALLDTSTYLVNHYTLMEKEQQAEINKFYKHFSMLTPDKEKRKSINN